MCKLNYYLKNFDNTAKIYRLLDIYHCSNEKICYLFEFNDYHFILILFCTNKEYNLRMRGILQV